MPECRLARNARLVYNIGIYRKCGKRGGGRWGEEGGKEKGRKKGGERKCKEAEVKYRLGFGDGNQEWGREGSGDCGIRVVIEESGVSK